MYPGAVKKDHLTIKDYYNFVINWYANLVGVYTYVWTSVTKVGNLCYRNICWSFEGCRQTFEGYKLTSVYVLSTYIYQCTSVQSMAQNTVMYCTMYY